MSVVDQTLLAQLDNRTLELIEQRRASRVRRRGWLVRRMLLLADIVGLLVAFAVAQALFGQHLFSPNHFGLLLETWFFVLTLPAWVFVAKLYSLYDRDEERTDHSTADDVVGVFHLVTVGAWLVFAGARLTGIARPDVVKTGVFWATAIGAICLARAGGRALCRRHVGYVQNTVIVGMDPVGQLIAQKYLRHPEYGINLVGFVRDPADDADQSASLPALGPPEELPRIIRLLDVERVVLAFRSEEDGDGTLELIRTLSSLNVQIDIVPRYFQVIGPGLNVHSVEGLPLIGLAPFRLSRSSRLLKRLFDVGLSAVALIVLMPVLLLVALAVKLTSRGPVLFRQTRMGSGDRPFSIWKFRTMVDGADEWKTRLAHLNKHAANGGDPRMFKIPDDPRTTSVGRILRRLSLDELPQLLNVLRGEMSLVGPRPLVLDEDRYVEGRARMRLDLRPGMTGLWQVLGREDIPFEEMVNLDCRYVTNWSLWLDLRLLLRTVPLVLGGGRGCS